MSGDYYEDLANEMSRTDRYVQPDEEDEYSLTAVAEWRNNNVTPKQEFNWERKHLLTEQDIVDRAARSQSIYQGPKPPKLRVTRSVPSWMLGGWSGAVRLRRGCVCLVDAMSWIGWLLVVLLVVGGPILIGYFIHVGKGKE